MTKIVIVTADNWSGFYKDGKLVWQDHNIKAINALEAAGVDSKQKEVDYDWFDTQGEFPDDLESVVFND